VVLGAAGGTINLPGGGVIVIPAGTPAGTTFTITGANTFDAPISVTVLGAQCRPNPDGRTQTCTVTPGARVTIQAAQQAPPPAATARPAAPAPPAPVAARPPAVAPVQQAPARPAVAPAQAPARPAVAPAQAVARPAAAPAALPRTGTGLMADNSVSLGMLAAGALLLLMGASSVAFATRRARD